MAALSAQTLPYFVVPNNFLAHCRPAKRLKIQINSCPAFTSENTKPSSLSGTNLSSNTAARHGYPKTKAMPFYSFISTCQSRSHNSMPCITKETGLS